MKATDSPSNTPPAPANRPQPGPRKFSLSSLSAAFARMASTPKETTSSTAPPAAVEPSASLSRPQLKIHAERDVAISPQMIIEAMLFVGADDSQPDATVETRGLTSRELSAHIRDVSPAEVDEFVVRLNQLYREETCPYEIVTTAGGYRMQLRQEFSGTRDRFRSPGRAIKLTPVAMEVLSIVAYKQPVTAEQIQKLRGTRSQTVLNQLVHRQLLKLERRAATPNKPWYRTTARFIGLFQLQSLDDLPQSADLDDS